MCSSDNRPSHALSKTRAIKLVGVLGMLAGGALATAPAIGSEPVSDRTLSVGLQIDRAGMQVVSFTLKDRPFRGPAEPAPLRPFGGVGLVQIEVRLIGDGTERFLRRVEVGPLCFDHGPETLSHIQGDTITVHRDAFLIELPEMEDADRVEIAYYQEHLGVVSRHTLGTDQLSESRFTPAAGPFSYSDVSFADSGAGATRESLSSTALWPEDFDDPDIYWIYGDPDAGIERINIVIVPDGYIYAQKALMEAHADAMVDSFRAKTPYAEHDSFINYTLVYAYSVDSGTDQCDCGVELDTTMGTRFPDAGNPCLDSGNRCLYYGGACDTSGTAHIIAAEQRAPFHDETIIMVNTTRYGGCGGFRAVYSAGHSSALEVAIHELGHSLAGLADEYAYEAGCGGNGGELNTSLNSVSGAWPEWIADLGAPREGARYYQSCIYRPLDNCEMRSLNQPFCPVCIQRWALVYFGHARIHPTAPIRSSSPSSPTSTEVGSPLAFTVTTRLATDVTNEIVWTLEGPGFPDPTVVAADVTEYEHTFTVLGDYILRCQVTADTNFIKPEKNAANVDRIAWLVSVFPPQTCDVQSDCNDGLPCSDDECLDNVCVYTPSDAACDDGIGCTADVCLVGGGCQNTPSDAACDDGDECTVDSCDVGSGGCVNEPNSCVVLQAGLVDLPICQDTSQDIIDVPLDVCNIYARLSSIDDRLLSVGFAEINASDGLFYKHPENEFGALAPLCEQIADVPDLICDSFVTIGATCGELDPANGTQTDGDFSLIEFINNGHIVGGWYNGNPPNGQGDPGPDLRILIAQLSMAQGQTASGTLTAYALIDAETLEFPGLEFLCEGGTSTCNVDCPTDVDFDGFTGAADLAQLLGCWGPITPSSPCACLDSDASGDIGAFDLAALLGVWGACP